VSGRTAQELLVLASQPASRVELLAGVRKGIHSLPLLRLGLGEMPLSGDLVPPSFYPPGVKSAQHVVGRLHGRFGVSELELRLPVRSFGAGKVLFCQA
jgi:hypothetical protein